MAGNGKFVSGRNFIITGRAVWPFLNKPDTKFDEDGVYRVSFDVDAALKDTLGAEAEAVLAAARNKFGSGIGQPNLLASVKPVFEKNEAGEKVATGEERIEFKFKAKRKLNGRKIDVSPIIVDAARKPVSEEIYGGSLIKASVYFQFSETSFGTHVSPRLKGVQVLELVGPDGVSAESLFDEVEGGFTTSGVSVPSGDEGQPGPADEEGEEF
jgi:hypothetical protein